jgi:glycosyltransferase involved in cell wall biosynthesis
MSDALVSVIIPCKNGAAWLSNTIESCLRQTWRSLEIVVVDNGSSDSSVEVAQGYASSSVVVLECKRAGASAARNMGLQQARGDFIQFLDADDVLDRDKIRVQMERLESAPSAIASSAWGRFRSDPNEAAFSPEAVWRDFAPEEFLITSWLGGGMMPNFAWLTPRAVIDKAGGWNERLSLNDDGEFFCRVALASSGILFCNDARGYYRTGTDGTLSRRRDQAAIASAFEAIELSCGWLLARGESNRGAKACAAQYQRFIYDAYPQAPDLVAAAELRVAELGGSDLQMQGGRLFRILSSWLGWKFAKRCQVAWQLLRNDKEVTPGRNQPDGSR